jgi:AmmeMemoRadiSam system protein A
MTDPADARLLDLAARSIRHGLATGRALPAAELEVPPDLRRPGAVFVTLKRQGELRGCIGSPVAWRPLIDDVLDNAHKAAFADPRFPPLAAREWEEGLELSVSVLTPPTPMTFKDEADLLAQIRPGIDGLIFEDRGRRGLFLPAVWEALPDPKQFLAHLKQKAGLPAHHWSATVKIHRFQAREIKPKSGKHA